MHEAQVRGIPDQSLLQTGLQARRKAAYRDRPIRRGTSLKDDVPKGTPKGTLPKNNILGGTSRTKNVPNVLGTKV